jgi:hypothetical protein
MAKWTKGEEAQIRKVASGRVTDAEKKPKPKPQIRMLDEDTDNMLKLSAALKIILSHTIILGEQDRVKELLYNYFETFLKVCLTFLLSYSTDSYDSYIFERLNKVLKSYHTNNHSGGDIEVSFMCAFNRDVSLREMVNIVTVYWHSIETKHFFYLLTIETSPLTDVTQEQADFFQEPESVRVILDTDSDVQGTVVALAQDINHTAVDGM